ncbi:hypothetical protein I4B40_002070 [Enterobacter cloacae]|nr:hypothetical protein [Enterobacter cloacae]
MNFRYIKGDWKDFYEAPDEAMLLVIDTVGRKYFTDIFPEPGGKYWSELGGHGVWGNAVKPDAFVLIAAREKLDGWDGEGIPPVGADVQCICNQFPSEGQEKLLGKILYSGEYTILHTYKTNEQHHVPVESVLMTKHWSITPIRSEADKKREIGVLSLARADPTVGRFEYGEKMSDGRLIGYAWYELYDKIAAGEVAGIRID